MKKVIALVGFATLPLATLSAQEATTGQESCKYGPYETNRARDNWFIGINGGIQTMFGGPNDHGSFGKRLAPVFDFNLGKWITPNVGVRGVLSWGQIKGFGEAGEKWISGKADADGYFKKKYNLFTAEADVLYNISNAWWGYKADRVYNCIPFAGFGIGRSYKDGSHATSPVIYAGIINNFRLSDAWSINLELKAGMASYYLDRSTMAGGRSAVVPAQLTVGVAYKFKTRNFKRVEKPDYTPSNQKIASLEDDLARATAQASRLKQELDAERAKKVPVAPAECNIPDQAIFFQINSAVVSKAEIMNLKLFADAIKQSPDTKFLVTGYADLQTGPLAFNQNLSVKRAQAVANVLVEKYGVNADQLVVAGGNLENPPFEDTRYNRAVILKID